MVGRDFGAVAAGAARIVPADGPGAAPSRAQCALVVVSALEAVSAIASVAVALVGSGRVAAPGVDAARVRVLEALVDVNATVAVAAPPVTAHAVVALMRVVAVSMLMAPAADGTCVWRALVHIEACETIPGQARWANAVVRPDRVAA